jgi:hypothetical protein
MAFRARSAGGRHFTDYPLLRATLDALLAKLSGEVIEPEDLPYSPGGLPEI